MKTKDVFSKGLETGIVKADRIFKIVSATSEVFYAIRELDIGEVNLVFKGARNWYQKDEGENEQL